MSASVVLVVIVVVAVVVGTRAPQPQALAPSIGAGTTKTTTSSPGDRPATGAPVPSAVGQVSEFPVGYHETKALTLSSDGSTLVVGVYDPASATKASGPSHVAVLDARTGRGRASIEADSGVLGVAITPDGRQIYATASNENVVDAIDVASGAVVARIPSGEFPQGVVMAPDGRTVWVAHYSAGTVAAIDTSTNAVRSTVTIGHHADLVAIDPRGRTLVIASESGITLVDTATSGVRSVSVPSVSTAIDLTVSPDGKRAYLSYSDGAASSPHGDLAIVDLASGTLVGVVETPTLSSAIASTSAGLLAAHSALGSNGTGSLSTIDPTSGASSASLPIGYDPSSLAVSPDGTLLYAVNGDDAISVVRLR